LNAARATKSAITSARPIHSITNKGPIVYERESSRILANKILDRPSGDPDDDLAVLARQLLRADEEIERLRSVSQQMLRKARNSEEGK
jgi:hypothetical protein